MGYIFCGRPIHQNNCILLDIHPCFKDVKQNNTLNIFRRITVYSLPSYNVFTSGSAYVKCSFLISQSHLNLSGESSEVFKDLMAVMRCVFPLCKSPLWHCSNSKCQCCSWGFVFKAKSYMLRTSSMCPLLFLLNESMLSSCVSHEKQVKQTWIYKWIKF